MQARTEEARRYAGAKLRSSLIEGVVKAAATIALLGIGAVELLYWLLRAAPGAWWLWAWAAFSLLTIVLAQLAPVLLFPLFFKMRLMSKDDAREAALIERLENTYARLRSANPKL